MEGWIGKWGLWLGGGLDREKGEYGWVEGWIGKRGSMVWWRDG